MAEESIKELYDRVIIDSTIIEIVVTALGVALTIICGLVCFAVLCTNGPLAVDSAWSLYVRLQGKPSELEALPEEGTVMQLLRLGPDSGEGSIAEGEADFIAI